VIVCALFEWKESLRFIYRLFINVLRLEIPKTGSTPPHVCTCPKLGPGFPTSSDVVFFVFSELRKEAIVRFIGGIADSHCFV